MSSYFSLVFGVWASVRRCLVHDGKIADRKKIISFFIVDVVSGYCHAVIDTKHTVKVRIYFLDHLSEGYFCFLSLLPSTSYLKIDVLLFSRANVYSLKEYDSQAVHAYGDSIVCIHCIVESYCVYSAQEMFGHICTTTKMEKETGRRQTIFEEKVCRAGRRSFQKERKPDQAPRTKLATIILPWRISGIYVSRCGSITG